ncbi:hypothetical protein [Burkholderia sp. F1]|uniref:hypothetical protein n=1 Tax=Burkholderia sp. F1 TaxID=3366817 RepID=UPI003D758036
MWKHSLLARCISVSIALVMAGCTVIADEPMAHETTSRPTKTPIATFPRGSGFIAFNGNRYANAAYLDGMGLVPFTSIYDVWNLSCDATKCYHVPTESQFKKVLASYVSEFRSSEFIAFDFEKIVIDAARSEAQAYNEVALFEKFIAWTREAYPNARLGMYDYDFNPKFRNIRATLYQAGGFDFFAPTMYQRWPNHSLWRTNLKAVAENDRAINRSLPVYAYVSPYKDGLTEHGFLGDDEWLDELSDAGRTINGVIVWTQSSPADRLDTNQRWLADLQRMISSARN